MTCDTRNGLQAAMGVSEQPVATGGPVPVSVDAPVPADSSPDDREGADPVVQAAQRGCAHSFEQLVRTHQKRLFYFILKHVTDTDEAQDLVQETLLQAYKSLPLFQGKSAFSTWVTGIALNLVRNHVTRAPHRRYHFIDDLELHELASEYADPLTETEFEELLRRVETAIQQLPMDLREPFIQIAVQGARYDEVAERLHLPLNTVKNRVFRARTVLREQLLGCG